MAAISKAFFPSIFALPASASFVFSYGGGWGVQNPGDVEFFQVPISTWLDQASNPNATGAITFDVPGLSDRGDIGFTLRLNVTADVPLTDAEHQGKVVMVTTMSLDTEYHNTSQNFCAGFFYGFSAETAAIQDLSSQDGAGCDQILSEECLSDLHDGLQSKIDTTCVGIFHLPKTCSGEFGSHSGHDGYTSAINGTQPILVDLGWNYTSKGDQKAWTEAATNVWPVFLAFIANDTSPVQTFLHCIRPDTFSQGTTQPNVTSSESTVTGTSTGASSSHTGAASRVGLPVIAVFGLGFNSAMWLL